MHVCFFTHFFDEITVHGHINSILSHGIQLDVWWISFPEKTFFSHSLQLHVHHFSKWFTTLNAGNIIWCFITLLLNKLFLTFLNAVLCFWHSMHVLSYSINSTYLSYVSGQGLPHASDNVKYWSFVRSPLRFTSSSHSIQV